MQSTGHDFDSIFPCSASPSPSQMTGPSFVSSVCAPGAMDELGGKVIQMGESSTNYLYMLLSLFNPSPVVTSNPLLPLSPSITLSFNV